MSKSIKKTKKGKENPGYPEYPKSEDIYQREEKEPFEEEGENFENGLDIPGAELDDEDEKLGSEDEENNYYSLGGDNHNDLEETNEDDIRDKG